MRSRGINEWISYGYQGRKYSEDGGGGEIRTLGGRESSTVFKTVALNRSATPPVRAWAADTTRLPALWEAPAGFFRLQASYWDNSYRLLC